MSEGVERNTRAIEGSVVTDFSDRMSYGGYLELDTLLAAQHPLSSPEHHDELLFIIQHQTTELWLKLVLHELVRCLPVPARRPARARAEVHRPRQAHPADADRAVVGAGDADARRVRAVPRRAGQRERLPVRAVPRRRVHPRQQERRDAARVRRRSRRREQLVRPTLEAPSLYDEFLRLLARSGYPIPAEVLERDVTQAWTFTPELVPIFASIYADPQSHWAAYETCEELVDLEDNFQLWRFRHLKTVDRIIGFKTGTGGSSGVPFLQKALELTFFPELFAVRTEIGQ